MHLEPSCLLKTKHGTVDFLSQDLWHLLRFLPLPSASVVPFLLRFSQGGLLGGIPGTRSATAGRFAVASPGFRIFASSF